MGVQAIIESGSQITLNAKSPLFIMDIQSVTPGCLMEVNLSALVEKEVLATNALLLNSTPTNTPPFAIGLVAAHTPLQPMTIWVVRQTP